MVDDAVNSVIAAAAKCAASIGDGTAKAHARVKIIGTFETADCARGAAALFNQLLDVMDKFNAN